MSDYISSPIFCKVISLLLLYFQRLLKTRISTLCNRILTYFSVAFLPFVVLVLKRINLHIFGYNHTFFHLGSISKIDYTNGLPNVTIHPCIHHLVIIFFFNWKIELPLLSSLQTGQHPIEQLEGRSLNFFLTCCWIHFCTSVNK